MKITKYLSYFSFGLNLILLFFLVFEKQLIVPIWLNPIGRLHPIMLHLPIGALTILLFFFLFKKHFEDKSFRTFFEIILVFLSLTSALSAFVGLLLAQENGYDPTALFWHKWTGFTFSALSYLALEFKNRIQNIKTLQIITLSSLSVFMLWAGHLGGEVTHGENFVFSGMSNDKKLDSERKTAFSQHIEPILDAKCRSCHNDKKTKGELNMTSIEKMLKGGKNGPLWFALDTLKSHILLRTQLPLEEKKHMPPAGKTQLTSDEKRIIKWWIEKNADYKLKVASLPKNDSLSLLAKKIFSQNAPEEKYDFKSADAELIKKLNNEYRVINSKSKTSPALDVTLYNSAFFTPATLNELIEIKDQIVSLNVSKTPITDADLKTIGQFKNLKKLNLNFTKITGNGLQNLATNTQLVSLSLAGINLTINNLELFLKKNKTINTLSLWNTNLTEDHLNKLKKGNPTIDFQKGGTENTLKLNLPFLKNKPIVFKDSIRLQIGHPINGVTIRFTTDNSEPDSLKSQIYVEGKTIFNKTTIIKAKAFKTGWFGSDMATFTLFKNSLKPDSIALLTKLNRVHPANGSATFFDHTFGTFNANSPAWANNWAGFRENNMELLFVYKKPVTLSEIGINLLIETETRIFPPQSIEIWGGTSEKNMKLLSTTKPIQPKELSKPYILTFYCKTKPTKATFFKVVAKPMEFVPNWHPAKGKVPLFLVDEMFVN